jgi:hypothetical protein
MTVNLKVSETSTNRKIKLDDFGRERLGGISHFLAEEMEQTDQDLK